jgi:hypothetical protein
MPEIQNLWPGQNPVTVRAAAALPAAGAYDAAPTEFPTANLSYIQFYITYTRGGVGGAVSMHVEYSPYSADVAGVQNWFRIPCIVCSPQAGGDATQTVQRASVVYTSTGAGVENVVWPDVPLELDGVVERMRVPCAESGAVGTPGTCHIVALTA